jgi:hypothetical protein
MGLQGDRHPADALLCADRLQHCVSRIRKVLPNDEAALCSASRLATAIIRIEARMAVNMLPVTHA